MKTYCALCLTLCSAGIVLGKTSEDAKAPPNPPNLGIDESAIDPKGSPCEDFYQYACGAWLQKTEIPADRPAWYRSFSEIEERNSKRQNEILERMSKNGGAGEIYGDKLGAFYGACMDEPQVAASATNDLKAELKKIDAVTSISSLEKAVARLHLGTANALFNFSSQQDFKDATLVIAGLDQGGIGLPDRDYYLKADPKFKEIREKYEAHVAKMLELGGETAEQAAKSAATVLKLEHELAEASMSRVDRRDPKRLYHRLDLAGIVKQAPKFPWKAYLADLGHPEIKQINVAVPDFFTRIDKLLSSVSLADWRTYLRWHTIHGTANALSEPFVDENFNFYGKVLQGTEKLLPRWKRCVQYTDRALGEALARPFVRETFGAEGKAATREMVLSVELAMMKNLVGLGWMDETTRMQALQKLGNIGNKIGYPDKWRNFDKLEVRRDSLLRNWIKAAEFETHRDLNKIGKPLDRTEWGMTPPTVNAYYDPSMNEMVFPAGILQVPFFNKSGPAAVNYGSIGMVMGHELTHGFDDEGRQFDAVGNLRDWWSPTVGKEFERRAECVTKQYDGYTAIADVKVNGKLTLGENIADLGGLKMALATYRTVNPSEAQTKIGKYTADQLFFLGFAQGWCVKRRDAFARMRAATDPHSPPQHRVNGPISNLPEFAKAFQCKAGQKMVRPPTDQCVIW